MIKASETCGPSSSKPIYICNGSPRIGEKGAKKIIEKIMGQNILNLTANINLYI
jgi:hypothetical protein